MKQLERVLEMREVKKGKYYIERQFIRLDIDKPISVDNEKIIGFILGKCPGCGSEIAGNIDMTEKPKEMPCFNKECTYKFIYENNSLYAI